MNISIPIAKPAVYPATNAIQAVVETGVLVNGPYTSEFESQWAEIQGASYCVLVNSGTSALEAALSALDEPEGSEVIVPGMSFHATAAAVSAVGYVPVFADIDPLTWTIDPVDAQRKITSKTIAILPVHLYGLMADMPALSRVAEMHGLSIIEDAAQAHLSAIDGKYPGQWSKSVAQCYSFYATKAVTTGGQGGAVTTSHQWMRDGVQMVRDNGESVKHVHMLAGHNFGITEVQAAMGLVSLSRLVPSQHVRMQNAKKLRNMLRGHVQMQFVPDGYLHSWHQFVIMASSVNRRRIIENALDAEGIGYGRHYPLSSPEQPFYGKKTLLPAADELARLGLSLPIGSWVTEGDLNRIANTVKAVAV
jgi:perosamine synthetase